MHLTRLRCPQVQAGWLLFALFIGIGSSAGCGESSRAGARLTGEVTLDGQPLPPKAYGSVTFRPMGAQGRPVSAQIVDSRYDCASVPKVKLLAVVSIAIPTGRTVKSDRMGGEEPEFETVLLSADQASGIELNVTGDANVNFELRRGKE